MRTLMTIQIEAEAGSRALESGTMQQTLVQLVERIRPEAALFSALDGLRTACSVFDLTEPAEMPSLMEPAFRELKARVQMAPAMNLDDLSAGLARIQQPIT